MTFDWWPKALTLEGLAALAKNPEATGGLTLGAIVTLTARYGFDALPSDPVMLVIALTGIFMGAFFISHTAYTYHSHWKFNSRRRLSCSFAALSEEQQQYLTALHRRNQDIDTRNSISEPFLQDLRDKGYIRFVNSDNINYNYLVIVTDPAQDELKRAARRGWLALPRTDERKRR